MSVYSYEAPGFAGFYDLMVEDLTRKGVIGQPDVEFYLQCLNKACKRQENGVFLDLATGTGRVVFDLVDRLKGPALTTGSLVLRTYINVRMYQLYVWNPYCMYTSACLSGR